MIHIPPLAQVGNQASEYCEPSETEMYSLVRRDTSYIYEEFMHTNGTDVKARAAAALWAPQPPAPLCAASEPHCAA